MSKHTEGPWKVEIVASSNPFENGHYKIQIQGPRQGISSVIVADMPIGFKELPKGQHATFDHQMNNARLIAAAPELLAALKQTLDALYNETVGGNSSPWIVSVKKQALEAIAKAEGGEND